MYRSCGKFTYHFARGKLRTDPAFVTLLSTRLLPTSARVLDLGCGQGLLAACLHAASTCHVEGIWPTAWPAPPLPASVRGIEIDAREVERARRALGPLAQIECDDLSVAALRSADAIIMLDVLHYLEPLAQRALIERAHDALSLGGVLILRIGNSAGGARFIWSRWVDAISWRLRGRGRAVLHFRTLAGWTELLGAAGFAVREIPMAGSKSFANVMLLATPLSTHPLSG
jgi:SAM-dependent methyltransferase